MGLKKILILGIFIYLFYWFTVQAYQGLNNYVCMFPTTKPEIMLIQLTGDNALYCGMLYAFLAFILLCLTIMLAFVLKSDN